MLNFSILANIHVRYNKNYFRILEVISSLNCKSEIEYSVGCKKKMSDLEVVALGLTAKFISIDSGNSLFKQICSNSISNLIKSSQFNKRRRKLFFFLEEVLIKLAEQFIDFEMSMFCKTNFVTSLLFTK